MVEFSTFGSLRRAIRDEKGRPVAIAKTKRDITEQKRAQVTLRASEERFRLLFERSLDAIVITDDDGRYLHVNRAASEMFGYPLDQLLRMSVADLMTLGPPSAAEQFAAYRAAGSGTGEFRFRSVGGAERVAEYAAVQLTAGQHLSILRDVTERKQVEITLRKSERFARSTLDGLSAQIAIVCREGTILAVNRAWREFAVANGAVAETVEPGANYLSACDRSVGPYSEKGPLVAAGIRAVLAGQLNEFVVEYPCDSPQQKRWLIVRVTPFPGDGPRRVVVAHEDVTQRKELEREVVEIASQEQRRIGQDLHDSVGQELTALNILAGDLAETQRTDPSSGSKLVDQMVGGLQRSQQELRAVLRGLLPVAVDAEGLMASLSDLARRVQQEGKATCKFDCPKPVAVTDNHTATHLYLIAQEAVHNAIKHAKPKNISISLTSDGHLVLKVQDDGMGIPTQPTENHGGLGLRIMQNRAAIIGATLTIQSAEPTGTLVTCTLMNKNP